MHVYSFSKWDIFLIHVRYIYIYIPTPRNIYSVGIYIAFAFTCLDPSNYDIMLLSTISRVFVKSL